MGYVDLQKLEREHHQKMEEAKKTNRIYSEIESVHGVVPQYVYFYELYGTIGTIFYENPDPIEMQVIFDTLPATEMLYYKQQSFAASPATPEFQESPEVKDTDEFHDMCGRFLLKVDRFGVSLDYFTKIFDETYRVSIKKPIGAFGLHSTSTPVRDRGKIIHYDRNLHMPNWLKALYDRDGECIGHSQIVAGFASDHKEPRRFTVWYWQTTPTVILPEHILFSKQGYKEATNESS